MEHKLGPFTIEVEDSLYATLSADGKTLKVRSKAEKPDFLKETGYRGILRDGALTERKEGTPASAADCPTLRPFGAKPDGYEE